MVLFLEASRRKRAQGCAPPKRAPKWQGGVVLLQGRGEREVCAGMAAGLLPLPPPPPWVARLPSLLRDLGCIASAVGGFLILQCVSRFPTIPSKKATALKFLPSPELSLAHPHPSLLCYLWSN